MQVLFIIVVACWCGVGVFIFNQEVNRPGREKDADPITNRRLVGYCCIWPFLLVVTVIYEICKFAMNQWIPLLQWSAFIGTALFIWMAKVALPDHFPLAVFYTGIVGLCAGYLIAVLEKKQYED
jgi:FtsH-binding integral membrane protein